MANPICTFIDAFKAPVSPPKSNKPCAEIWPPMDIDPISKQLEDMTAKVVLLQQKKCVQQNLTLN